MARGISSDSMKRRAAVRCAAAQDDDYAGSASDGEDLELRLPKSRRKEEAGEAAKAKEAAKEEKETAEEEGKRSGKKKEFAWMDSDEEVEEEKEKDEEESRSAPRGQDRAQKESDREGRESDGEEEIEATVEALEEAQSFGRMMRLSTGLTKKLKSRPPPELVVAACRALGRTKFFDSDILNELTSTLRRLFREEKLNTVQANDVLLCFHSLNFYDQGVLASLATAFRNKTGNIESSIRSSWLDIYKGFNHATDKDFTQLLDTPPLTAISPGYQKLRCRFHAQGACHLDKACTYSHDPRAPISLEATLPLARASPLVMTQSQYTMGRKTYGGARNGQFVS